MITALATKRAMARKDAQAQCPLGFGGGTQSSVYECPLCKTMLFDASRVTPCGCTFCHMCAERLRDCLRCGADVHGVERDTALNAQVETTVEAHVRGMEPVAAVQYLLQAAARHEKLGKNYAAACVRYARACVVLEEQEQSVRPWLEAVVAEFKCAELSCMARYHPEWTSGRAPSSVWRDAMRRFERVLHMLDSLMVDGETNDTMTEYRVLLCTTWALCVWENVRPEGESMAISSETDIDSVPDSDPHQPVPCCERVVELMASAMGHAAALQKNGLSLQVSSALNLVIVLTATLKNANGNDTFDLSTAMANVAFSAVLGRTLSGSFCRRASCFCAHVTASSRTTSHGGVRCLVHVSVLTVGKKSAKEAWAEVPVAEHATRMRGSNAVDLKADYIKDNETLVARLDGDKQRGYVVALDECGDAPGSSAQFAELFYKWAELGNSHITFVIGGADGLPYVIKQDAAAPRTKRKYVQHFLSLSELTFTHKMARALICEQIYRATEIRKGSGYNK
ncbi:Ribosomal RNA large subunit methyltransferase H [Porphyridium purpureum]|uniref:Ribosomal RNA large subunit methyltransferase H n=1 Tax=Porphyridium purpureum TaxID=35688 RepID=A0A5J4YMA3_PORPP|nr:Ribosomal RNA large subunit methyltransferase H [Porphyridium purpureum]|eukprot:POR1360..scf249_10